MFGASGAVPVFVLGSWWTVLSATWLHGGLLHIVFNMMWVRDIGPSTADVIGPARTVIIYVVSGVCGFLLSSVAGAYFPPIPLLHGASLTVGASASIFGLLGALVHYGRKSGSSLIHAQAKQWAMIMFIYGLVMPGIDNFAHAGGFLGGYAMSALFNPLTQGTRRSPADRGALPAWRRSWRSLRRSTGGCRCRCSDEKRQHGGHGKKSRRARFTSNRCRVSPLLFVPCLPC